MPESFCRLYYTIFPCAGKSFLFDFKGAIGYAEAIKNMRRRPV